MLGRSRYLFGSPQYYPEVSTFSDLPSASGNTGRIFIVTTGSWVGLWYHRPGLYRSDGTSWSRLAPLTTVSDEKFTLYDEVDNTRGANFECGTIATGTTRTFTFPNASGTLMLGENNLSDVATAATARTNLGLGSIATHDGNQDLETSDNVVFNTIESTATVSAGTNAATLTTIGDHGIGFIGDVVDKINASAEGKLNFYTANTERLEIDSTEATFAVPIAATGLTLTNDLAVAHGGTGSSNAGDARTALGVAIGSDVQAYDATLLSIAALGTAAGKMLYTTGIDTWAESDITLSARQLIDDVTFANMRNTLGLGPIAIYDGNQNLRTTNSPTFAGLTLSQDADLVFTGEFDNITVDLKDERYLTLDGIGDDVLVADNASMDAVSFSICLWVYLDGAPDALDTLAAKADANLYGYTLRIDAAGKVEGRVRINAGTYYTVTSSSVVPTDEWVFICWSYTSGAGNNNIYVNGSNTSDTGGGQDRSTGNNFYIGSKNNASGFVTGYIDEVMYFNDDLSSAEAAAVYALGRNAGSYVHGDLVSHWRFDDATADDDKAANNGAFEGNASAGILALDFDNNIKATSYTDRTPAWRATPYDALQAIAGIKEKNGRIDHSTLPAFARRGDSRNLGNMVTVLVEAVKYLGQEVERLKIE